MIFWTSVVLIMLTVTASTLLIIMIVLITDLLLDRARDKSIGQ